MQANEKKIFSFILFKPQKYRFYQKVKAPNFATIVCHWCQYFEHFSSNEKLIHEAYMIENYNVMKQKERNLKKMQDLHKRIQ